MKKLPIKSENYQTLLEKFTHWLKALGYAEKTIKSWPIHVQEYLYHLEATHHIKHVAQITKTAHNSYLTRLETRRNERDGTGLSTYTIRKYMIAVNSFERFLNLMSQGEYNLPNTFKIVNSSSSRPILTTQEIQQLYKITYGYHRENEEAMGQRARAILGVYYGAGLRLSEGHQLNIEDIDFSERMLHVRKGKGRKERHVPLVAQNAEDLKRYIEEGREWFMEKHTNHYQRYEQKEKVDREALFISQRGTRLSSDGIYQVIKKLIKKSPVQKEVSTHHLRHSIATHLLQNGMELEKIKAFLGHASLESTQIYLHLSHENEPI